MKRFATVAAGMAMAVGMVACGGSPTSPSTVTSVGTAPFSGGGSFGGRSQTKATVGATVTESDRAFIEFAAMANAMEIELGRLGEPRGDLAAVKFYARQLIQDHTIALAQLREVAADFFPRTVTLDATQQALLSSLSLQSGHAFDRDFTANVVLDHQAVIARFQQQGVTANSPALRSYATDLLANMVMDLQTAQELAQRAR